MAESKSFLNVPVPRRQFLKATSAAAVGFAAAGLFRPESLLAAGAPVVLPLLGVGFTPDELGPKGARLVDATDVSSGDPTFLSRGARLTIASFSPLPSRSKRSAPGAAIDAIFPVYGQSAEKYPRFQAWCYRAKESGVEAGATSFTMPVTATDGIQLVVRPLAAPGADAAAATQSPFSLSLGSRNGTYKLQKGTYVVAFREETEGGGAPLWQRLTLVRHNEHEIVVPGAHFSYVVVSVDYAK